MGMTGDDLMYWNIAHKNKPAVDAQGRQVVLTLGGGATVAPYPQSVR